MKKYFNLFLLITVFSLLLSCRKEEATAIAVNRIVIDSVKYDWQPVAQFSYTEPNVLRAMVIRKNGNNYAMFYSNDVVLYLDSTLNQWDIYAPYLYQQIPNEVEYPAINKDMVLGVSNNSYFSIYDPIINNSVGNNPLYHINYASYDTNFKQIGLAVDELPNVRFNDFYAALSDSNRMLIPIQLKNGHFCFYSFDIKITFQVYSLTNFKRIFIPDSLSPSQAIFSFGNRFIVNASSGSYLIRENGTVKQVSTTGDDWVYYFKVNNTLFVTEYYTGNIYTSIDNGETWTLQYQISNSFVKFFPFDGNIIGVLEGQLWQFDFQPTNLVIKEINNYGLSGHLITSILKFNNTVYVSTTSGVFTRPYSSFYQYK